MQSLSDGTTVVAQRPRAPRGARLDVHVLIDTLELGGSTTMVAELASAADIAGIDLTVAYLGGEEAWPLLERLRAAGIEPQRVELQGHMKALAMRGVRRHLAERRPQLLHTHLRRADALGGPAARSLGIPVVSTLHDVDVPEGREGAKAWAAAAARRTCARRLIAASEYARERYLAHGWDRPERIVVVPNGIADRAERGAGAGVRAELGIAPEAPVIAMVSRLSPEKAHDVALAAFARLRETTPTARLLIVGDGPARAEVERLAAPFGDAARLLGERDDVMRLLDASDVLLRPSRDDPFPAAALEAMAAAVPAAVSAAGALPEIVVDGETGTVVPGAPQAEAVAAALAALLADDERRIRLGRQARRRFEREFTLERWAHRMGRVYSETLDL